MECWWTPRPLVPHLPVWMCSAPGAQSSFEREIRSGTMRPECTGSRPHWPKRGQPQMAIAGPVCPHTTIDITWLTISPLDPRAACVC
eukprot:7314618-Pyramimonas_sp.AAC.1